MAGRFFLDVLPLLNPSSPPRPIDSVVTVLRFTAYDGAQRMLRATPGNPARRACHVTLARLMIGFDDSYCSLRYILRNGAHMIRKVSPLSLAG